ncbi:hypothetical protein [uncultured Shewanella sp.]|uniref:hypothetical protein n=1 Tax=uncultured Shewanella sp. TaxID=173975 RepID=UPI002628733C|nr:hypothetical protein [uncultured Shewanella sp.]
MQDEFYLPFNVNELIIISSCMTSIIVSLGLLFLYHASLNNKLNTRVQLIITKCLNNRASISAYQQHQQLHDIYLDSMNIRTLTRNIDYIHVIKIYAQYQHIYKQASPFMKNDDKLRIQEKQHQGTKYLALLAYRHSNGLVITQEHVNKIKKLKIMFIQETQYAIAKSLDLLAVYSKTHQSNSLSQFRLK